MKNIITIVSLLLSILISRANENVVLSDTISIYNQNEMIESQTDSIGGTMRIIAGGSLSQNGFISPEKLPTFAIKQYSRPGDIPMTSEITQNGSKTYTIPIRVHPGINGMQPDISLVYNSMSGNGELGVGWSLKGISRITRSTRNYHYDGDARGIRKDSLDSFYLDGNRLIQIENNGSTITYQTEFGYIKAIATFDGSKIKYFNVYYPDGRQALFGDLTHDTNQIHYPITWIADACGNEMTYSYSWEGLNYAILYIFYNTDYQVKFTYSDNRKDPIKLFIGGEEFTETRLLTKIECQRNGLSVEDYKLYYDSSKPFSALHKIENYGGGGISNNPLTFYYGDDSNKTATFSETYSTINKWWTPSDTTKKDMVVMLGKFDYKNSNDGLITYIGKDAYQEIYEPGTILSHSHKYFKNNYTGDEDILLYSGLERLTSPEVTTIKTGNGFVDILTIDFDGSKNDRIVKVNNFVENPTTDRLKLTVYDKNVVIREYSYNMGTPMVDYRGRHSIHPRFYYSGDFLGNGKQQLIAVSINSPFPDETRQTECTLFDIESGSILYKGNLLNYNVVLNGRENQSDKTPDKLFAIDCDGDGKTDICHITSTGIRVYTIANTSDTTISWEKISDTNSITNSDFNFRQAFLGDMNGDGFADIVLSPRVSKGDTNQWNVYYSKGDGSFKYEYFYGPRLNNNEESDLFVQDVDNDGKSDLIISNSTAFSTYLNEANVFSSTACNTKSLPEDTYLAQISVFSTNGYSNLVALRHNTIRYYAFSRDRVLEQKLTSSVSSLGVIEQNHYKYIERPESGFYQPGTEAEYPYVDVNLRIPVVFKSAKYVNGDEIAYREFTYYGGILNRHGLGFLGFEQIQSVDKKRLHLSEYYDPYMYGVKLKENSEKESISSQYTLNRYSNGTADILLSTKTEKDLINGITKTTKYTYKDGEFGYPGSELIEYSDGYIKKNTYRYTHSTSLNSYILGKPRLLSTEYRYNNETLREQTTFTWTSNGQLSTKVSDKINEKYSYNSDGTLTKKESTDYQNGERRIYTYQYDKYGFLTNLTDNLKNQETYEYNYRGDCIASCDKYGAKTTYEFDHLGNMIKKVTPDGVTRSYSYKWCEDSSDTPVWFKTENNSNGQELKEYYDAFGREVKTSSKDIFDKVISKITEYDEDGNIILESQPFYGTEYTDATIKRYDEFRRLTSVRTPYGKTTNYSYSGLKTTISENGEKKELISNSQGWVVSIKDFAGEISFDYRPNGLLRSTTTPNGKNNEYEYDKAGRIVKKSDISHNPIVYTYDSYGRKLTEKDGANIDLAYTYTEEGLLKTKKNEVETYMYTYDDKLDLVNIHSRSYNKDISRDQLGRVSTESESSLFGGVTLNKTYTYIADKIASIEYTSSKGLNAKESFVYRYGILKESYLNDTINIYTLKGSNEFGLPTQITTGLVNRNYAYDKYGYPISRKFTTNLLPEWPIIPIDNTSDNKENIFPEGVILPQIEILRNDEIQIQKNDFDQERGRLNYNSFYGDNKRTLYEYDEHDRLTAVRRQSTTKPNASYTDSILVSYDNHGNVLSKSTLGIFEYDLESPYHLISALFTGKDTMRVAERREFGYYEYGRPMYITQYVEDKVNDTYFYNNSDNERVYMDAFIGNERKPFIVKNYLGGNYEYVVTPEGIEERLYLGGDYYQASSIFVKKDDDENLYHLIRDYLGSITCITDSKGVSVEQRRFDAWGRVIEINGKPAEELEYTPLMFERGFTGHEHLHWLGLINMNARLYDPAIGRFVSPDTELQDPHYSQNYNRYAYAYNNPMKYTDPDGKFVFSALVALGELIYNVSKHGFNTSQYRWKKTENALKIDVGMFNGNIGQVLNKWTFGIVNSFIGNIIAHSVNLIYDSKVTSMNGLIAVSGVFNDPKAMTIGHYSFGPKNFIATWKDHMFVHEYGHYIQSQYLGPLYLPIIGLPSVISAAGNNHRAYWTETNASRLGANYFNRKYGAGHNGYENGSKNYFDIESFISNINSPYDNPRDGGKYWYNYWGYPI